MGGNWVGFYKYKLAAFYAAAEDQPIPARPKGLEEPIEEGVVDKPDVLFGGKVMRWLHVEKEKDIENYRDICYGALQAKRGLPRPDKAFLDQTLIDTFIKLTVQKHEPIYPKHGRRLVPYESVIQDLYEYNEIADDVELNVDEKTWKKEFKKDVKTVFGGKKYTNDARYTCYFPSTNANYNMSRAEGGGLGELLSTPALFERLKTKEKLIIAEKFRSKGKGTIAINCIDLDHSFEELHKAVLEAAMAEDASVELVALAEALKARVISKGPPLTYFVLKSLQRFMWDILFHDKSGSFKLIGEEIGVDYLCNQLKELREGEKFLSGDYKDATNNLKPWVSECIAEAISEECELTERESQLFKRALTQHIIVPPKNLVGIGPITQKHGQLMGSIVSFIVLCMANATVMRRSREVSLGRSLNLNTANIAVNGDDCVARLTERGLLAWRGFGKSIGLEESVGKTYYSERFLNMNSARFLVKKSVKKTYTDLPMYGEYGTSESTQTIYRITKTKTNIFLEHRKFINLGLCFGLKRSTKGDLTSANISDVGSEQSWGAIAHDLKRTCPKKFWDRAYKLFLNRNWDSMQLTGRPRYLPERLGGLGLPVDENHQPTEKDLRLAAAIYNLGCLPAKPAMTSWRIWSLAMKEREEMSKEQSNMQELGIKTLYEHAPGGNTISESALMGRICVSLLFNKELNDLTCEATGRQKSYVSHCDYIISQAYKRMSVTEKFQSDALPELMRPAAGKETYILMTARSLERYAVTNIEKQRISSYDTLDEHLDDVDKWIINNVDLAWQ
jgi:hypothetical protein